MVTKYCPSCKGKHETFDPSAFMQECPWCNRSFASSKFLDDPNESPKGNGPAISASAVAQLIDTPDAGLVYIHNRFDNTDWDAFVESSEVIIPELEEMVEKSKIKFGATATAWQLDFESVSFPLTKKLEGLSKLADKIVKANADGDSVAYEQSFDLYKTVVDTLCDEKDTLIKRLENDVKYAAEFQPDDAVLEKMNSTLATIKASLDALKPIKYSSEIPEVAAAQRKIDEEKLKEFASRGIAARQIYSEAEAMMKTDDYDRNELLRRLEAIRGYSDVNDKISAINLYYDFNSEYYNFCGKSFIFKLKEKENLFNPSATGDKKPKKEEKNPVAKPEDEYNGDILQLFEVVDKKPAKEPILDNITQVLTIYGSRLYYIKLDSSICYFDIVTKREFELDKGKVGDYICEGKVYYNKDHTAIYIRKKLPLEVLKKGCLDKLLKKQDEAIERRNNYSLLQVSLVSDFSNTVIKEMVDITEALSTKIFYTKAEELSLEEIKAKKKADAKKAATTPTEEEDDEEEIKLEFRVYDMVSGDDCSLLDENCVIHSVVDGNVIFTRFSPNAYNRDLYAYNIEKGEEVLIETNVLDYERSIKGRIYYTVGNDDFCPMFSNNLEGTDRFEVMRNVEDIVAVLAGWMYIIKRVGSYRALIRVSSDGKTRQVVCLDFGTDIKVTDLYIYYISTAGALRVARTDGKENTLIADNISASSVIVDKDRIYYLRNEPVDRKKNAASLYCMDIDGHNVRKILFDVNAIDNYDKETIMIKRTEEALYEITIPVDAKNTKTEKQTYVLTHFCKYDKVSGNIDTLLTLGLPDENEYEFKGCFGLGKKKKFNSTCKQIPKKITYQRANVAKVGSVFGQQANDQGVATVDPINKLNEMGGCGAGCASILSNLGKK